MLRPPISTLFPYTTLFRSRSRKAGAFKERELDLCQTISSAMAIALRNARVLQSLRDQTQQVTVARFEAERSEEHTSELQSRRDLVCRLLLEKKKKALGLID